MDYIKGVMIDSIQDLMNQISSYTDKAFRNDVHYRCARETERSYQANINALILKRNDSSMAQFDTYSAAIEKIKRSEEYRAACSRVNIARVSVVIVQVLVVTVTTRIATEVMGWMGAPSK